MTLPDLSGKTILVTGASRGLGAAVALQAAKTGAHVIALARTTGALEELDDQITAAGGKATLIPFDLTKFDDLETLGPLLLGRIPQLDGWVSCAMQSGTLGPVAHSKLVDFRKLFEIAVLANVQMIRSLDPLLRKSPAAHVVFVTDDLANKGPAYWGPYAVAKTALQKLAETYAAEQGTTNITVHTFDPGIMSTNIRHKHFPGEDAATLPQPEQAALKILQLF
jgi:NAD(P)-dependent dehydrogenase (short-subunit alcohol dehydrogenase family)